MKYRFKSWWWGRFVMRNPKGHWVDESGQVHLNHKFSEKDLEPYDEEKHGLHNCKD